jgi:hypothetical protein
MKTLNKRESAELIFRRQFKEGMKNKNFEGFKRDFPTLYEVTIKSIIESLNQNENT